MADRPHNGQNGYGKLGTKELHAAFERHTKPLITLLNDFNADLGQRIQSRTRSIEELVEQTRSDSTVVNDHLVEAIKAHIDERSKLDQQALAELTDNLRSIVNENRQQFEASFTSNAEKLEEILEQSRKTLFKSLEITRRRAAEIFEQGHLDLKEFVASQTRLVQRESEATTQNFAKQRAQLSEAIDNAHEKHRDELQRAIEEVTSAGENQVAEIVKALDQFQDGIEKRTQSALEDSFSQSFNDFEAKYSEALDEVKRENEKIQRASKELVEAFTQENREVLGDQLSKRFDRVVEKLEEVGKAQTEKFDGIHQTFEKFLQEDIKRAATEVKFLDRFIERFQNIAAEERNELQSLIKAGKNEIVTTVKRIENDGSNIAAGAVEVSNSKLDKMLQNFHKTASERLRMVPRKFIMPKSAYVFFGVVALLLLLSPLAVLYFSSAGKSFLAAAPPAENQMGTDGLDFASPHELEKVRMKNNIAVGNKNKKRIAITFDGGSNAKAAVEILDILKDKKIPTTVFLTGEFILNHPALTKRILKDGHEIGNHTWDHPNFLEQQMPSKELLRFLIKQLMDTEKMFYAVTGQKIAPLWRAPFGAYSDRLLRVAKGVGYTHVYWTEDTRDWVADKSSFLYLPAEKIKEKLLSLTTKKDGGNGSIILMHLGTDRQPDDMPHKVLPEVIDRMRDQGYEFVRVSQIVQ